MGVLILNIASASQCIIVVDVEEKVYCKRIYCRCPPQQFQTTDLLQKNILVVFISLISFATCAPCSPMAPFDSS